MKRYKVIPLALNGRAKKIYRPGDIVTEENLLTKPDELVAKGFLEEIPEEPAPVVETAPIPPVLPPAPPAAEAESVKEPETKVQPDVSTGPSFASAAGLTDVSETVKSIDDITRKEIIKDLKERGVEFDENANKKTLYEIWVKK